MNYFLIEKEIAISSNASVLARIPNAHKYNSVSFKSIIFFNGAGDVVEPTTGTVLAFVISDSENVGLKDHWPWSLKSAPNEWYDSISVAQLRSINSGFFTYESPPDFVGITFAGINPLVTNIKVKWMAFK